MDVDKLFRRQRFVNWLKVSSQILLQSEVKQKEILACKGFPALGSGWCQTLFPAMDCLLNVASSCDWFFGKTAPVLIGFKVLLLLWVRFLL